MKLKQLLNADWEQMLNYSQQQKRLRPLFSCFHPRFAPVYLIRLSQRLHDKGWKSLAKIASFLNVLIFTLEVPPRLSIGPGLVIPHPYGTILGAGKIGTNVTIYQQVTLGAKLADYLYVLDDRPIVEDDVIITAGAKIIGPIKLGRGCIIGANSVVLDDVPPGCLAVGVPAVIKQKT
jgi:serine O-acetyltransferase